MVFYRTIQNTIKGYRFLSFTRNMSDKCGIKLLDTTTKIEVEAAKIASKNLAHKTAEVAGELIGNEIKSPKKL